MKTSLRAGLLLLLVAFLAVGGLFGEQFSRQAMAEVSDVAAIVNGESISREEYLTVLERRFGRDVLDTMIMERLIDQGLEREGVEVPEEELQAEFDRIKAQFPDEEQWQSALKRSGLTEDALKADIRREMRFEVLFADRITVDDADVQKVYEQNADRLGGQPLEAVHEQIKSQLEIEQLQELVTEWLTNEREKAEVEVFLDL